MRPLTALIGILLGTCVSATFSLAVLSLISVFLPGAHSELSGQTPQFLRLLFAALVLTAAAAASFIGQLQLRAWRGRAHLVTVAVLVGIVLWYSHGR